MDSGVRRCRLSRECLDARLFAEALAFPGSLHVSVYGGDLPHIGAVSVVGPDGAVATTQFPGHRDGAVSEAWAKALSERGFRPAVVEAGIHYDGITPEGIRRVLEAGEALLAALLAEMSEAGDEAH